MGRSEEITQFLARLESLIREGNWEGAFNLEEFSPIMEGLNTRTSPKNCGQALVVMGGRC